MKNEECYLFLINLEEVGLHVKEKSRVFCFYFNFVGKVKNRFCL